MWGLHAHKKDLAVFTVFHILSRALRSYRGAFCFPSPVIRLSHIDFEEYITPPVVDIISPKAILMVNSFPARKK